MDEFWLWVIALIAAVVILFGVPFNCIKSTGTNKKVVLIGNGIMVGVLVLLLVFTLVDSLIRSPYERKYDRESGGFFKTFRYIDTVESYHIFSYSGWLDGANIAVSVGKCDMPLLAPVYPNVIVYYDELKPLYKDFITIEGNKYYVSESIEAVFTDYSDIILVILLFDVPLLFMFNLLEIFIVLEGTKHGNSVS